MLWQQHGHMIKIKTMAWFEVATLRIRGTNTLSSKPEALENTAEFRGPGGVFEGGEHKASNIFGLRATKTNYFLTYFALNVNFFELQIQVVTQLGYNLDNRTADSIEAVISIIDTV